MNNVKISELNSLLSADSEDLLPIVDVSANETKKIAIQDLNIDANGDTLPVGAIIEYDGNTIPEGYEEVSIGYLPMKAKKLWENTDISANFPARTITLSSDDYDYLLINYTSGGSTIIKKGQTTDLTFVYYDNGFYLMTRNCAYVSDTSYAFNNATLNGGERNWLIKPIEIWGIKFGG